MMRVQESLIESFVVVILSFLMVTSLMSEVYGQEAPKYPTKPIKVIVAYPPGGTSDIAARLLAQWIAEKKKLPQPIVVVNRPGAAGSIGQTEAVTAPSDGYTLLLEAQMAAAMPVILPNPPFVLEKRTWIASMFIDPYLFFVRSDSEFKTLKDVVNRAKADPTTFSWATPGATGNAAFTIGLLLYKNGILPTKTNMLVFQGGGEMVNAVAGGHAMLGCDSQIKGLVVGGKLRPLAVVASQRHPEYPNIPTVAEAGFPGFPTELVPYNGISGPPNLPPYVVEPWVKIIREATEDPVFKQRAEASGKIVVFWGPEESKRVMMKNHETFKEMAPLLGLVKK